MPIEFPQINVSQMLRIGFLCALLPLAFAGGKVDPALVGSWQLVVPNPAQGPRWIWDINADGSYSLHAEGATAIPLHNGTITANKGKYKLKSTSIDWVDTGTYDASTADVLRSNGKLGEARWLRAQTGKVPAPAGDHASAPSLPYEAAMRAGLATHSFVLILFHGKGPHTDHLASVLRESILNDPTLAEQLIFADADVSNKVTAAAARKFQITQWPALFLLTTRPPADNPRFAIFGERYGDLDADTVHALVLASMCGSYMFSSAMRDVPPKGEALKKACEVRMVAPEITTAVVDPPALPPLPPPARNRATAGKR